MLTLNRRGFLGTAPLLRLALPAPLALDVPHLAAAASPAPVFAKLDPLSAYDVQLGFALSPSVRQWQPQPGNSQDRMVYRDAGYTLEVDFLRPAASFTTCQFRLAREDNHPFDVHRYLIRSRLEFTDIYRFWDFHTSQQETYAEFAAYLRDLSAGEEFAQTYGANLGVPMLLCTDREGHTRYGFGLLNQVEATGLRIKNYSLGLSRRGEGLNFEFEFERPLGYTLRRAEIIDGAYFDARGQDWFPTVRQYSRWVESTAKITPLQPPPVAFEPIWNSWYPFGFDITEESIGKNAEICQKLGIKNISIDSGYQNSLLTGLGTPEDIATFSDFTGDWTANPKKFPDFAKLVKHIHDMGQIATVWIALFMVGKKTKAYSEVSGMMRYDAAGKDTGHLCPRHRDTPAYLARTFLKLAQDYDLDGFWLDFMDDEHLPCHASHPHCTESTGEGYNACFAAVRDALIKYKPAFVIETRMAMANINAKQFANVLETIDMPFDLDVNRSLGVVVRSYSEGVASKIDPIQWHIHESDENVSVCCATVTLAGVPVFGVDFRLLPPSHLRVVEAWMKFYREHQAALAQGRFAPVGFGHLAPQLMVQQGGKTFLYIGSSSTNPAAVTEANEIYLVNASGLPRVAIFLDQMSHGRWQIIIRNCYFEKLSEDTIDVGTSSFAWDKEIPKGGIAELHKVS